MIDDISQENWERYAKGFADYNIYQTWPYQQMRCDMDGQELSRIVIINQNDEVELMSHIRIKQAKLLGLRIGYAQWGPLMQGKNGRLKCSVTALEIFRQTYLAAGVNVLRIAPNIFQDDGGTKVAQMLETAGFDPVLSIKPYHTIVLSLEGSEEDLRKRFRRGWRRNLKKAEQAGIEIKCGNSSEYFDVLEDMYYAALKRKRFRGLDPREFSGPQQVLSKNEKMNVVLAYLDGEPVTALATSSLGDTAFDVLAANSEKALKCGSSFLVYWNAFNNSKSMGATKYDLGGINPENNPSVYQFKSGMGGKEQRHIGIYEATANFVAKTTWHIADKIYRYVKK